MLRTFPSYVVDDIVEILYNILYKNVHVGNKGHKAFLLRKKRILSKIVGAHKNKKLRKQLIYKQRGGFIGSLIPILTSVLSGILGSAL